MGIPVAGVQGESILAKATCLLVEEAVRESVGVERVPIARRKPLIHKHPPAVVGLARQSTGNKGRVEPAGGANTEAGILLGALQATSGHLGSRGGGVEGADKEDSLWEEEMGSGTGRASAFGVEIGNRLVAIRTSPATDNLLESFCEVRSGSITRWRSGLDC